MEYDHLIVPGMNYRRTKEDIMKDVKHDAKEGNMTGCHKPQQKNSCHGVKRKGSKAISPPSGIDDIDDLPHIPIQEQLKRINPAVA